MLRLATGCIFVSACIAISCLGYAIQGDHLVPAIHVPQPDLQKRFSNETDEVPDFQKHVVPMLGRLGCNGRSCHGSFQGQGGFQLSLFGYDFAADHKELMEEGSGRVDVNDPHESLVLAKPSDEDYHEGGLRFGEESWQYRVIHNWIAGGAKSPDQLHSLERLELLPREIVADSTSKVQLKAIAHWSDGTSEDVTPLTRFQTNDDQVAQITENGLVSSSQSGDTHVVAFYDRAVVPVPVLRPVATPISRISFPDEATQVDRLVLQKLDKLGIEQSELTDDATFLRRVYLDVAGTLPSPEVIREFLADDSPDKRRAVVEKLLETPAYAALWTTFLCDLTGNNSQDLREMNFGNDFASRKWYEWIYERVGNNVPYDEIVEGILLSNSRLENESYTDYCGRMSSMVSVSRGNTDTESPELATMPFFWMRREFEKPEERAISVAHAFLGVRIQCAQCHKHPFDQWSKTDFEQFSRFFTGVKYMRANRVGKEDQKELKEILASIQVEDKKGGNLNRAIQQAVLKGQAVPFAQLEISQPQKPNAARNRNKRKKGQPKVSPYFQTARLLGNEATNLGLYDDVRQPVMEWMRSPENPYFAKAIVNRIWSHYFGVGIVEPADDLNLANPPSNAQLLDYLANGFIESGFDLKWIHREITASRTYQLSWKTNSSNAHDRHNFSRALPRRLPAEVVVDALTQSTAADKLNAEFLDRIKARAISIPGTNVGGKQRNTSGFALDVFGRSSRTNNCDCDRSNETSLIQTVFMQNDYAVHSLLANKEGWIGKMVEAGESDKNQQRESKRVVDLERRLEGLKKNVRKV